MVDDPPLDLGDLYGLALSGTWRPTEAERRLADPEVLAAMDDLKKIPEEMLPARVKTPISARSTVRRSSARWRSW